MALTIEHIHSAQQNDIEGIAAVFAEMDSRINSLAYGAARGAAGYGTGHLADANDFRQDAREALFVAVSRYDGETVDGFRAFAHSSMRDTLRDKVRAQRYPGVSEKAVKDFGAMVRKAGGDLSLAAKLAQTDLPKGSRFSPVRAQALRMAFLGEVPFKDDDDWTHPESTLGLPGEGDVAQPKVGRGAVLEALSVIERYVTLPANGAALLEALDALRDGFTTAETVDALEDCITVPRDPQIRRYVLDSMGILRAAASVATEGDVAEDLRNAADVARDERPIKIGRVRQVLDAMGELQRTVLVNSFGIYDGPSFGVGNSGDLAGLAESIGRDKGTTKVYRRNGILAFAKRYVPLIARNEEHAAELHQAAKESHSRWDA